MTFNYSKLWTRDKIINVSHGFTTCFENLCLLLFLEIDRVNRKRKIKNWFKDIYYYRNEFTLYFIVLPSSILLNKITSSGKHIGYQNKTIILNNNSIDYV